MQLDIFNINDFIKANHCPEITNPIFWNYDGTPTTDGLFSYELFGYSDEDRKNIFGYIDLKGHYVHPLVYLTMTAKMGSLGDIITGKKYAVIADKKIKIVKEDFPGAETGIDFLYDNYEQINWIDSISESEIDSIDKKTRLKFFKSLKKDEFFVDKWLVLPPFYRAESSLNRSMGDAINKLYKELISKVKSMQLGFSFNIFGAETKYRIQTILKDLYLSTLSPLSGKNLIIEKGKSEGELKGAGKNSMIRKHLLGKTIDWSASSVITSPTNSNANTPDKKPVPWGYSAFPLAILLALFQPFYLNWCCDFLESAINNFVSDDFMANKIGKINVTQYNTTEVEKLIKKFIKDENDRFDAISINYKDKDGKDQVASLSFFEFKNENDAKNDRNYIRRPFTITDLFYLASKDILKDKHVYVTRYPVANFQNIYPCRPKILSTAKVKKIWYKFYLGDNAYVDDNYPMIFGIDGADRYDSAFYDVTLCGNAYLDTLGRRL